jgi:hypothetical protein
VGTTPKTASKTGRLSGMGERGEQSGGSLVTKRLPRRRDTITFPQVCTQLLSVKHIPFSSLFILAMSRASGLWRVSLPPDPPLQARGSTEKYSQKNASTRLLAVIRPKSRQHSLFNCLAMSLPVTGLSLSQLGASVEISAIPSNRRPSVRLTNRIWMSRAEAR